MATDTTEQILKETVNALYYMQTGITESVVPGHLILTNLRIAFLEGLKKRGLLSNIGRKEARPVINFSIARLIGANIATRQKISQTQTKGVIASEMQRVLIIILNTPTGPESFTFEVEDPEAWVNLINMLAPTRKESVQNSTPTVTAQPPIRQTPSRKPSNNQIKQKKEVAIEVDDVKFCPECGKELESNARFCWECGSPQPDTD